MKKVFDSEKEFRRWLFLLEEVKVGRISCLQCGRTFFLHGPNGTQITWYKADFVYVRNGRLVVEDVKSDMTRKLGTWKYKKKWMKDEYGIEVQEV